MKAVLMEQLSWGLEPNGKKKKRVFTLAAMDIKASANLLGHDVASRHRLDIRGKPSAIAMPQVIELMRGPSTKLPYWRSGTKHGGTVAVLRELEGWLGGMAVDARAGKQPFPAPAAPAAPADRVDRYRTNGSWRDCCVQGWRRARRAASR